jgi:hypothetical protein
MRRVRSRIYDFASSLISTLTIICTKHHFSPYFLIVNKTYLFSLSLSLSLSAGCRAHRRRSSPGAITATLPANDQTQTD